MSALQVGQSIEVPEHGKNWQVWSKAGDRGPGAYFVVKDGVTLVIRARREKGSVHPIITLLGQL